MILRWPHYAYALFLVAFLRELCAESKFGGLAPMVAPSSQPLFNNDEDGGGGSGVERTTTIMELRPDLSAKIVLKRKLSPADSFTGSYTFLKRDVNLTLLSIIDEDSLEVLAKCQFNNRRNANNNNNKNFAIEAEQQQEQQQGETTTRPGPTSNWLHFEWKIDDGLLWCHTPEFETIFKLDNNKAHEQPKAYTVEISYSNSSALCLKDLRVNEAMDAARCPLNNITSEHILSAVGARCGCASLNDDNSSVGGVSEAQQREEPAAIVVDEEGANRSAELLSDSSSIDNENVFAFRAADSADAPLLLHASAIRGSGESAAENVFGALPNPIAFPIFKPSNVAPTSAAHELSMELTSSRNAVAPVFDHLKVSPLPDASARPTEKSNEASGTERSVPQSAAFTSAPEIWIRATRPPFHHGKTTTRHFALPIAQAVVANGEITAANDVNHIHDSNAQRLSTNVSPHESTNSMESIDSTALSLPMMSGVMGPADAAVESASPGVIEKSAPVCAPKCEMGGVCVERVNAPEGAPRNICQCPDGLLGQNCNIRNPCANASQCTTRFGAMAQCIMDAESMAAKAPPVFVEAPHLCVCQDDNSEWKECEELFKMEFQNGVPQQSTRQPLLITENATDSHARADESASFDVDESLRFAPGGEIDARNENGATRVQPLAAIPAAASNNASETARDKTTTTSSSDDQRSGGGVNSSGSALRSLEAQPKPEIIPRPTFPMHRNLHNSSFSSSETSEGDANESEASDGESFVGGVVDSVASLNSNRSATFSPKFTRFPGFNTSLPQRLNESDTVVPPHTVIHLPTPTEQSNSDSSDGETVKEGDNFEASEFFASTEAAGSTPERNASAVKSNVSQKESLAPTALALPMPTDAETLVVKSSTQTTITTTTTKARTTTTTTTTMKPRVVSVDLASAAMEKEAEGDNGFERVTQHIHTDAQPPLPTRSPAHNTPIAEMETDFGRVGDFAPHEEHGGAFEHRGSENFVTPGELLTESATTTTFAALPEAEDIESTSIFENANNHVGQPPPPPPLTSTRNHSAASNNGQRADGEKKEDATAYDARVTKVTHSLAWSATSWFIGVGVIGFVLISLAIGGACVMRYIRRSRRLHGKYNPSREESALATSYAMPMTSVGKEERLI